MTGCERCRVENPSGFRFCGACGAALPEASAAPRQTRRFVTALFCDVTGSTALGEELDPEVLADVVGASPYMAGKAAHISGVVVNGSTLKIPCCTPNPISSRG